VKNGTGTANAPAATHKTTGATISFVDHVRLYHRRIRMAPLPSILVVLLGDQF
jgi:hypothetical protein